MAVGEPGDLNCQLNIITGLDFFLDYCGIMLFIFEDAAPSVLLSLSYWLSFSSDSCCSLTLPVEES